MSKTWKETKAIIESDFYRNTRTIDKKNYLKAFIKSNNTMSLLLYYRICNYFCELDRRNIIQFISHCFCYVRFTTIKNKCGIELNQHTQIGKGLRLPHKGCIVIHPLAVIGDNCEIMQGVTIGNNLLKDSNAVAVIGDEVIMCAGSKIIGGVKINSTVLVGANAVVTHDVPGNSKVAGSPARVIGTFNSEYIINKLM